MKQRNPIYKNRCKYAWDGNENGVEWKLGAVVHQSIDDELFDVYEDDGEGNGNLLASFEDKGLAIKFVDLYCEAMDQRSIKYYLDNDLHLKLQSLCNKASSVCSKLIKFLGLNKNET